MTTVTPFDLAPTITSATPVEPVSSATHWIRLTTDPPPVPERITRAQLAQEIDKVMGITNHCTGAKTPEAYNTSGEQTAEQYAQEQLAGQGCQELATRLSVSQNCTLDKRLGNPLIKNVYVHCSSDTVRGDYTLRSTGSAIILSGPTPSRRIIRLEIDFGETNYVPVRYYAESKEVSELWRTRGYEPTWEGPVLQGITRIIPPTPHWRVSGTVVLNQTVSGKIIIFLPILFDSYTVSIPGQQIGNKRDYNARFVAASQYLDKPSQITLDDETDNDPQANDCSVCGGDSAPFPDSFDLDDLLTGGEGTGGLVVGGDEAEDDQPEWPTEIGCCDGEEIEYTPYQESVFTGFRDLPEAVKEQYIRRYGPDTEFIGVGPTDPPCGQRIERQRAETCNYCEGVSPITYRDDLSPSVITEGWYAKVYFDGGTLPYFVDLQGTGFWLDDSGTISSGEVNSRSFNIYALGSCGVCTVTVQDDCQNTEAVQLRSTNCNWVSIYECYATGGDPVCSSSCYSGIYKYFENRCGTGCDDCDDGFATCGGPLEDICGGDGDYVEGKQIWRCDCS